MSNSHQEKFITKLLLGFTFITGGIFVIMYSALSKVSEADWYFWGILAAVLVNAGIYLLLTAFVHKVKSDFIKRQKQREQQKTFTAD